MSIHGAPETMKKQAVASRLYVYVPPSVSMWWWLLMLAGSQQNRYLFSWTWHKCCY